MPRFPRDELLALPVLFERLIPGRQHPDGRRYLPLLVFTLTDNVQIGVVDRHHLVDERLAGRRGSAKLIFLLSSIHIQQPGSQRNGLEPEWRGGGHVSTAPSIAGQVLEIASWELTSHAGYEALYTELVLDIGMGVVGVRTNITAPEIAAVLGAATISPGDWLSVTRSRIDILAFEPHEEEPCLRNDTSPPTA